LSYVDALFDREHDRIHVVERKDGRRVYQEYPANYIFYYEDPRGKFQSLFGTPVSQDSALATTKSFAKKFVYSQASNCMRVISIQSFVV
jgi:hypothetical protein